MVSHQMVSHQMVSHQMVSYHMVSYHMVSSKPSQRIASRNGGDKDAACGVAGRLEAAYRRTWRNVSRHFRIDVPKRFLNRRLR